MSDHKTIDEKTVEYVGKLSRIDLGLKEKSLYSTQLASILGYISKLEELNTSKVLPTSHPLDSLKNVFRKDEAKKSLTQEEALQNAPKKKDSFFSVPKIIE